MPLGETWGARKRSMNTKEMLKRLSLPQEKLDAELHGVFGDESADSASLVGTFEPDTILKGRVIDIVNEDVIVDVGYKSEGVISKSEFENPEEIDIGDE